MADGEVISDASEPEVIFRLDDFGGLGLMSYPGRQWEPDGRQAQAPRP